MLEQTIEGHKFLSANQAADTQSAANLFRRETLEELRNPTTFPSKLPDQATKLPPGLKSNDLLHNPDLHSAASKVHTLNGDLHFGNDNWYTWLADREKAQNHANKIGYNSIATNECGGSSGIYKNHGDGGTGSNNTLEIPSIFRMDGNRNNYADLPMNSQGGGYAGGDPSHQLYESGGGCGGAGGGGFEYRPTQTQSSIFAENGNDLTNWSPDLANMANHRTNTPPNFFQPLTSPSESGVCSAESKPVYQDRNGGGKTAEQEQGVGGYAAEHGQGGGGGYAVEHGQGGGGGYAVEHGQGGGGGYAAEHGQGGGGGYAVEHGQGGGGGYAAEHGKGGSGGGSGKAPEHVHGHKSHRHNKHAHEVVHSPNRNHSGNKTENYDPYVQQGLI